MNQSDLDGLSIEILGYVKVTANGNKDRRKWSIVNAQEKLNWFYSSENNSSFEPDITYNLSTREAGWGWRIRFIDNLGSGGLVWKKGIK